MAAVKKIAQKSGRRIGFFQCNVVVDQRVGDVEKFVLEAECAAHRDHLDDEVTGTLDRWLTRWTRSW